MPLVRMLPILCKVPKNHGRFVDRESVATLAQNKTSMHPAIPTASERLPRLLNVPVQVSVRIAEKKIEMGQLLGLAPGSIITFDTSCEALLDLFVNNRLYCRGEAVKIGEKFGLKVNEVGSVDEHTCPVVDPMM